MNLLSQRIKKAKRELTALKTAHRRGLGNLRVYYQTFNIPTSGHESGLWDVNITIDFDRNYAAYPFMYMLSTTSGSGSGGSIAIEQSNMNYMNSGYTVRLGAIFIYRQGANTYTIVSSAPVISVSYRWVS